jgi:hypothetical protein
MIDKARGKYFGYMVYIEAVTGANCRRADWPVVQRRAKKTKSLRGTLA